MSCAVTGRSLVRRFWDHFVASGCTLLTPFYTHTKPNAGLTQITFEGSFGLILGGHFGITFLYSTGGQTLYLKTVFAWAIVQPRVRFACDTYRGPGKMIKSGKWSPKNGENRQKGFKIARKVKKWAREINRISASYTFGVGPTHPCPARHSFALQLDSPRTLICPQN
jgi:hypothetical protein